MHTTLLLDDSPRKAELQPYNHICIPEYDGTRRKEDLQAFETEKKLTLQAHHQIPDELGDTAVVHDLDEMIAAGEDVKGEPVDNSDEQGGKKRKRKEKKVKKATVMAASVADFLSGDPYDYILLAVVGILDEVKHQGNVAAWIRSGGLWGITVESGHGDDDFAGFSGGKMPNNTSQDEVGLHEAKRTRGLDEVPLHADPTGNDAISTTIPDRPIEPESVVTPDANISNSDKASSASAPMWFENGETVRYWAGRGKKVLEEMGIPILHGIGR